MEDYELGECGRVEPVVNLVHEEVGSLQPIEKASRSIYPVCRNPSCKYYLKIEERKQAAADVLFQYSQFVMVCIGEGVRPSDLRLHLMKELSGMPTSLKKDPSSQTPQSPPETNGPSSSGTAKRDSIDSSPL